MKTKSIIETYMTLCSCWRNKLAILNVRFLEQLHSIDWMSPSFNELMHSLYKQLGATIVTTGLLRSSSPIHR